MGACLSNLLESEIVEQEAETDSKISESQYKLGEKLQNNNLDDNDTISNGIVIDKTTTTINNDNNTINNNISTNVIDQTINPIDLKDDLQILCKLGSGSFGTVDLLRSGTQLIAMKTIELKNKGLSKEAAEKEIAVMKKTSHNNLVKLFQVVFHKAQNCFKCDQYFLFMEFVSGGNLSEHVNPTKKLLDFKALPEKHCETVFFQLLKGLHNLHFNGIAHRDLKPENILINTNHSINLIKSLLNGSNTNKTAGFSIKQLVEEDIIDSVKIVDFGSAHWNSDCDNGITGTRYYLPPERLGFCESDDIRDYCETKESYYKWDIYSLGVIIYIIYFGQHPKQSEENKEWLKQERKEFTFPECDSDLKDLLEKMLSFNPINRPTTSTIYEHPFFQKKNVEIELLKPVEITPQDTRSAVDNGTPFFFSFSINKIKNFSSGPTQRMQKNVFTNYILKMQVETRSSLNSDTDFFSESEIDEVILFNPKGNNEIQKKLDKIDENKDEYGFGYVENSTTDEKLKNIHETDYNMNLPSVSHKELFDFVYCSNAGDDISAEIRVMLNYEEFKEFFDPERRLRTIIRTVTKMNHLINHVKNKNKILNSCNELTEISTSCKEAPQDLKTEIETETETRYDGEYNERMYNNFSSFENLERIESLETDDIVFEVSGKIVSSVNANSIELPSLNSFDWGAIYQISAFEKENEVMTSKIKELLVKNHLNNVI
eukprot:TRINITY_DN4627_c0_g1_i1.p1 TRINITY_DN4627_c0_g1~~TRINITY_DN4627_c0_g1_i1.p1  ORF type:complete len:714 (+),score=189.93 TRINITY_DN4627_c0_g1_i1:319-2460(+)